MNPRYALFLLLGILLALAVQVWAQGTSTTPYTMGIVVATCGTPPYTYTAGTQQPITIGAATGAICVSQ